MQSLSEVMISYCMRMLLTLATVEADMLYPFSSVLLARQCIYQSTGFPVSVMTFLVLC